MTEKQEYLLTIFLKQILNALFELYFNLLDKYEILSR